MKNQKGVSLIALIITIIVIIILAAIVMNSSTDTVGNAQYAKFAQEFGEYSDQVALKAADVKADVGIKGQIINNAQNYFMTAAGMTAVGTSGEGVFNYTLPAGYVVPDTIKEILGISGDEIVAYVIGDQFIPNYTKFTNNTDGSAGKEFYGDSNGKEYHFITSDGQVFTLPGYPVEQSDRTIQYHIDTKDGHYYVVTGNSGKSKDTNNVNNDNIDETKPIIASDFSSSVKGLNQDNDPTTTLGSKAVKIQ